MITLYIPRFSAHSVCFLSWIYFATICTLKNIGFDVRGDVKVFDFGLCKDLDPRLKNKEGGGYRLTGRAGSLPYSEYSLYAKHHHDSIASHLITFLTLVVHSFSPLFCSGA